MPKDWNSVSESDQQSQDERGRQQQKQVKKQQEQSKQQTSQGSSGQQPSQTKIAEDVKQRPKFLSDEELIEKLKSKQIEQRKKIKIVNCKSEELIEMIHNHKLINYLRELKRQGKPTTYIACFKTQQDLIAFVQQKIANKYRFFLHTYIKTARDIQKEKEYQEKKRQRGEENRDRREQNNRDRRAEENRKGEDSRREQDYRRRQDKGRKEDYRKQNNQIHRDYDHRRQNEYRRTTEQSQRQRGRNRPQYEVEEKQQKRATEQGQRQRGRNRPQYEVQEKQQKRAPEQGQRRRGYNRPQYDVEEKQQKTYDDRKEKRYEPKNPSQNRREQKPLSQPSVNTVSSKPEAKQKTSQTHEFNYVIDKNQIKILSNIYSKNRIVDDIVEFKMASKWDRIKIYVRKDGLNKVLELAELIWDKISYGLKALPDENAKDQFIQVVLQTKCHLIHPNTQFGLLTDNSKKYFDKVSSKNKYIIQKEFSIEEYVKGFKQSQREICKKWKQWIVKAENDNISNLLKLSWKLRKEFYLNINIVVGKRGQVPFAVLQIQPESDKEKRPKPDTSVVNNYLN